MIRWLMAIALTSVVIHGVWGMIRENGIAAKLEAYQVMSGNIIGLCILFAAAYTAHSLF